MTTGKTDKTAKSNEASGLDAQFQTQHEFIKALHRRYREEGIEISYPVRVIVPSGDGKGPVPV